MKIFTSAEQLIGHTPLLELTHIEKQFNLKAKIIAKLEMFNPAGSAKDRVAKKMIEEAEKNGTLKPGSTIIEPTSGNTGIGLAHVAATRGYKAIIVMPDTMSKERILTMKAYGAQVVLSDGSKGMAGCIEKAEEIKAANPGSIIAGQFTNPANPQAHFETTGPEIYEDTDGKIDFFVAGVGTGGTITGCGRYLKSKNPSIKVIAVEPASSALLSGEKAGPHAIQGIGANFIPEILDTQIYDEILKCSDEDSLKFGALIGKTEGILCGISSGAALWGAINIASRPENSGKTIVVLFPDHGDRYLSTKMFSD
ncbi:MAG: cysteine synthase A [Treponema sp.]|nr:cysteine synthase A [Candidatus Treponema merdequi]